MPFYSHTFKTLCINFEPQEFNLKKTLCLLKKLGTQYNTIVFSNYSVNQRHSDSKLLFRHFSRHVHSLKIIAPEARPNENAKEKSKSMDNCVWSLIFLFFFFFSFFTF